MKLQLLLITLLFSCSLSAQNKKADILHPKIAKELVSRRAKDQKGRNKYIKLINKGKTDTPKFKAFVEGLINIDEENTNRMREIVTEIGWPTYAKVGERASNAAWIIVQHADRQPDFQAYCLPLVKEGYEAGQVNPSNYAYLYDRVKKSRGERQLYATQPIDHPLTDERSFSGIDDEANVQVNRTKMDVNQPVVDYAASMNFSYSVPSEKEAEERKKAATVACQGLVTKARTAMQVRDFATAADHYLEASSHTGNMTMEDRIEAARAVSLGKHKNARAGVYFLMQAVLHGHPQPEALIAEEDFAALKKDGLQQLFRYDGELLATRRSAGDLEILTADADGRNWATKYRVPNTLNITYRFFPTSENLYVQARQGGQLFVTTQFDAERFRFVALDTPKLNSRRVTDLNTYNGDTYVTTLSGTFIGETERFRASRRE